MKELSMTALDPGVPLPSKEELTVPELNLSTPVLKAGAHHFGKQCDTESKEFMLCCAEEKDPRKCLKEGAAVTECGFKVFRAIRDNCRGEFEKYWRCLEHARGVQELSWCRKTQKPFDKCVLDKLGWERPELGYFSRVRLHETDRPKPELYEGQQPEWIPGPTPEMRDGRLPPKERRTQFTGPPI